MSASAKTCERCGKPTAYRRVTCACCGRAVGLWYDCGCAEKWTESGPPRYFCAKNRMPEHRDCENHKAKLVAKLDQLPKSFLAKMKRLNGRWP